MSFDRGAPAFWFVEIRLDTETLRLTNAFETILFDGQNYAPFGDRMTPPSDIDRSADLKAQKFSITLDSSRQGDSSDPVGKILDSNWRRRPVRVRYAVGGMDSGGYDFSDPFVIADEAGRIKSIEDTIEAGSAPELEIEIESGALVFLERRNQTRSPANQRAVFPDDAFFDHALKLDGVVLPWRTKKARNGKVQIQYDVEGAAPREMLIGRGVTKGSFVYGATGGQQRKYWAQVYALADCRCEALEEIWINGAPVLNGTVLSHGTRTPLAAFASPDTRLWVTWYDGRHDQTADSYLISLSAGQPLAWTSNHRGRGVSYAIIEHLWDDDNPEAFTYEFQLRGARIYQERLDSTAGGSGSHRIDDPDTWTYSTNAAEALRHFLRGRVVSPSSPVMWFGVGADVDFLDPHAVYAYQAAHCDDDVDLKLGGTQKRYEANGWISAANDHKTNLQRLADCMVADAVDEGNRISIRLPEPQTPVVELLDLDLISDEETVIDANARADDVVNRIEGRFQDPANKYQAVDFPAVADSDFAEIDGAELTETWNQALEISEERAQRKALLFLNKRRRTAELEEHFGTKAKDVRPGDWVTRKSALRGFPDGKLFIADEVRRFADGTVRLILLEVDPGEKIWNEADAALTPTTGFPSIETEALGVPDIAVTAITLSAAGVVLPGVRFTITGAADAMGDEVIVEYGIWNGLSGGSAAIVGPSYYEKIPGNVATFDGLAGLLPGTGYAFRFRARDGERLSAWSSFKTAVMSGTYQAGRSAIADLIVGQGWGATAPITDAGNIYVGTGQNILLHPLFNIVAGYWEISASVADTRSTAESNGIRYRQSVLNGTPAAGSNVLIFASYTANCLPVQAGQRVGVRCLLGGINMSTLRLAIAWYNAAGTNFSDTVVQDITSVSLQGGGAVSTYHELSGVAVVPATAIYARFYVRGFANGGASPTLRLARPLMALLPDGQLTAPAWGIGFPAIPGADPTAHFAVTLNPRFPLSSSSSTSISVAATTVTRPNESFSLPSATITGLSADTNYAVFRDLQTSTYIAASSGIDTYATNLARYIPLGVQKTQQSGGGFSPPPSPPAGGGGGGSGGSGGLDWNFVLP